MGSCQSTPVFFTNEEITAINHMTKRFVDEMCTVSFDVNCENPQKLVCAYFGFLQDKLEPTVLEKFKAYNDYRYNLNFILRCVQKYVIILDTYPYCKENMLIGLEDKPTAIRGICLTYTDHTF